MNKSVRTIALMTVLTLTAVPMLKAEPMGTNPRPQEDVPASVWSGFGHGILALLGM